MYKNQQRYFTKISIPVDVIDKSNRIIKERIDRKPQKLVIKKKVDVKKKKGIKELEREKLMKLYGKSNNMISLLIFLLKRGENKKDKTQYKPKSQYGRRGYRKGNNYQTKSQLDKERKDKSKKADIIAKDKKAFTDAGKLIQKANSPTSTPNQRQLYLQQAEKIAKDRLVEADYEKYSKYVSGPSAEISARKVLDVKEAVEKELQKADIDRKKELKERQNLGREKAKKEKDESYGKFIDLINFEEKLKPVEREKFYEEYKNDYPDILKPSKITFMNLLNKKYKVFVDSIEEVGIEAVVKESKKEKRLQKNIHRKSNNRRNKIIS